MDIHRCRFVPYQPQAINALAFSHTSPKQRTPTELRLALGRENGDLEIWNPTSGNWVQEKILRGGSGRTIEQLVWTQDLVVDEDNVERPIDDGQLRLFSSGGSTSITEWDIAKGTQKRHAEGNFGDIWCFAAQPQWRATLKGQDITKVSTSSSQMLAAGCSDGTVVLFSTADDSVRYLRTLAQNNGKKSKVISITWKDRNTIVAGYENSQIKVMDVEKRTTVRTMSLGRPADGSNIVVWTVKCLSDGTLLSGDSTGELKIWDAVNYTLVQRLKTHEADILDISTSVKGDLLFTAGVDRRTVVYQPLLTESGKRRDRWQQVMHRRFHQHDVKALASFESKELSVLVSGGMDTVPIVMPLGNFDLEYHRSLPHLPQTPQMSCSLTRRLLLTWWGRDLLIWKLPRKGSQWEGQLDSYSDGGNHKLVARVQLQGDESITSAQISNNGQMVVAATSSGIKLFQIRERAVRGEHDVRIRTLDLPAGIQNFGATIAGFSPDSKWLYTVRSSNIITLVKVMPASQPKESPYIHHRVIELARKSRKTNAGKLGNYRQSINCLTVSSDSRIIASGDLYGNIDVWILEGHEKTNQQVHNFGAQQSSLARQESESESDSDSDSDNETDSAVIDGQKWVRSPYGPQLPQLDSPVIALSFKPALKVNNTSSKDTVGLHATRHTPHPVSHEHPLAAQVVAVTSTHNIVEFDVLSCRISSWSRRNPSSCLPNTFTQLKDRVMGTFWDCNGAYERLYLYGSGFLFMLDLSQDLNLVDAQEKIGRLGRYDVREALPDSAVQEKVVASAASPLRLNKRKRKRNTGAGDAIKEGEWQKRGEQSGLHADIKNAENLPAIVADTGLLSPVLSQADDDMDIDEQETTLAAFRRQNNAEAPASSSKALVDDSVTSTLVPETQPYFSTFRYRSIFGIAVMGSSTTQTQSEAGSTTKDDLEETTSANPGLEVVIVERPLYDLELLPRFDGGQDWGS